MKEYGDFSQTNVEILLPYGYLVTLTAVLLDGVFIATAHRLAHREHPDN